MKIKILLQGAFLLGGGTLALRSSPSGIRVFPGGCKCLCPGGCSPVWGQQAATMPFGAVSGSPDTTWGRGGQDDKAHLRGSEPPRVEPWPQPCSTLMSSLCCVLSNGDRSAESDVPRLPAPPLTALGCWRWAGGGLDGFPVAPWPGRRPGVPLPTSTGFLWLL